MARDFALPGRSPVRGVNGMAATSMPQSTLAALDVLRAGGNALDAAVAAVAVQCVIEPQSTGIGGDCFCLYAPAGASKPFAINGSGRAPAAATIDWFESQGISAMENTSPHAVTIPGAVGAWEALLKKYGTKGFDELLRPAIAYAENGFVVHDRTGNDWEGSLGKLSKNAASARHFLVDGRTPRAGEIFRQPALAATLSAIAKGGARAFYEGAIAADMVKTLRALGGLHTEADFAANAPEFVDPIRGPYRGMEIFQCPPNGSGLLVLMLAGILQGWDPVEEGPLSPLRLHRHIEAARLVYRDRDAFLADPAQVDVPVARLTAMGYLDELRASIDDRRAMRELPPAGMAALMPVHADTVYLCVVDRDGNACSFINSLFEGFGSGILAEESGVMLQTRGFGFRVQRGHPNCIAPNKRPMHTIIPGMLFKDGKCIAPYGVMGGHYQPFGHTNFLENMFAYGMDPQAALDAPRLFPRNGEVQCESGIPQSVVDRLDRMGHACVAAKPHGGGQAIFIDHQAGTLTGASDPRKDGMALGW